MSWIASSHVQAPQGDIIAPQLFAMAETLPETEAEGAGLASGTLMLEADLGRAPREDHMLFFLNRRGEEPSLLSVHLGADGTLTLARRLGDQSRQRTLHHNGARPRGPIRVTYTWDSARKTCLLSLEIAEEGVLIQKGFTNPLPILSADVAHLCAPGNGTRFHPVLRSVSISDRAEPVGLSPCYAPGTPINTPQGFQPVEALAPGDEVLTYDGAARRIVWAGMREVPANGRFGPIRLLSPYFGLRRDVIVAPEARLVVSGPEVEYLFGQESVLVEASAFQNTGFATGVPGVATIRYHHLLLEQHEILDVAGSPMESLYIGNLRKRPEILATTVLRDFPRPQLPRHERLACRALRDYEAFTLRAAMLSR